eukprot:CAMPEP_0182899354 /NCGR_PEP_ID=MMETSP0034_2-20130328/28031_1 /TAXON_ID=156128 /ORGANISM="Nephroselmis pyriformis, Strain CCMP717" /LENGTH=323 /DNA_ID=CAMNT_0025033381 /DNA_START=39 /DNA_END=1006 /DNA_ORIENTATION=-
MSLANLREGSRLGRRGGSNSFVIRRNAEKKKYEEKTVLQVHGVQISPISLTFDHKDLEKRYNRLYDIMPSLYPLFILAGFVLAGVVFILWSRHDNGISTRLLVRQGLFTTAITFIFVALATLFRFMSKRKGWDHKWSYFYISVLFTGASFYNGYINHTLVGEQNDLFDALEDEEALREKLDVWVQSFFLARYCMIQSQIIVILFFYARFQYYHLIYWVLATFATSLVVWRVWMKDIHAAIGLSFVLMSISIPAMLAMLGYLNEKARREKYLLVEQCMSHRDTTHMNFIDHQMKQKFAGSHMLLVQMRDILEAGRAEADAEAAG